MASRVARLFPLLLVLVACEGDPVHMLPPQPPPPIQYPTFSLVDTAYWAGAPISIRMRGDAPRPHTATLLTDQGTSVPLVILDDSTLTGNLPRNTYGGRHDVRIALDQFVTAIDSMTVFGPTWQSYTPLDLPEGTLHGIADPGRSSRFFIGGANPLGVIDFTGYSDLDPQLGAYRLTAPGPTQDPSIWLLRSRPDGPLERWQLGNTVPEYLGSLPYTGHGTWQTHAQLGPDRLLAINGDDATLLARSGAGYDTTRSLTLTGFKRVVVSPRGDRATVTTSQGTLDPGLPSVVNGVPVFSVPEGEVAYLLPATPTVSAAAFSPDGSMLAVATGPSWNNTREVQLHEAITGTLLRKIQAGYNPVRGVAFDPHRPILYLYVRVQDWDGGELYELQAWSTVTWARLGAMTGRCWDGCGREVLIVVGPGNEVYVVQTKLGPENGALIVWGHTVPEMATQ